MLNKKLLDVMRVFIINPTEDVTDERMVKAITINENMRSAGCCLKPDDIVQLAKDSDLDNAWKRFKDSLYDFKAQPYYANFPLEVLNMDEAMFRFHQALHYFSTYGVEMLTGTEMHRGWVPNCEDIAKTEDDETLLSAKVVELVSEDNVQNYVINRLVSTHTRMSEEQIQLLDEIFQSKYYDEDTLEVGTVPFKENISEIWRHTGNKGILLKLCKHTGDIMKVLSDELDRNGWHLKTSERRSFVQMIESYPVHDFRENIVLSKKERDKNVHMLDRISYNRYSRSGQHKEVLNQARNKQLKNWNMVMEEKFRNRDKDLVHFLAKRPGIFLRKIAHLLRAGYSEDEIVEELLSCADKLNLTTILTAYNNTLTDNTLSLGKDFFDFDTISRVLSTAMLVRMYYLDTPFANKKVYIKKGDYDLSASVVLRNETSSGYLRAGLAIRIPETVKYMRGFTYWNDKRRVDLDLHAYFTTTTDHDMEHVGWNSDFKKHNIVSSGDMTVSDSAEYIDIDLSNTDVDKVYLCLDYFNNDGGKTLNDVEVVFGGLMAVNKLNEKVKLYNPKNSIFTTDLHISNATIQFGVLDVPNRIYRTGVMPIHGVYSENIKEYKGISVEDYLNLMFMVQKAELVTDKEEADVVLSMDKQDGCISILDNNYFLDC